MNFEFMTIDTPLPPCMPFPRALTGFPVSSTAKVMYCRMLDAMLSKGQEDENGILFVCFPVTAIAAVLSRSPMTVKRSLNELETAGLIMRVRQGIGEPNRIYVLIPGKGDATPSPLRFGRCRANVHWTFCTPALAAASYPFVDLPSGDTLRCKLFPADKFHKICYLFNKQYCILNSVVNWIFET